LGIKNRCDKKEEKKRERRGHAACEFIVKSSFHGKCGYPS
jgi:hypothetical protein